MNVREQIEAREESFLSPYAVKSAQSRGREREIEPCTLRTAFQRDRDRILHCKSFRRLKGKTQVFLVPQGDHYRTRLTHTLEVSQVARTLARALCLNEDLTEAIALGHDLGHTPFGHIGERTLDRMTPDGFDHKDQSLRVVDVLEDLNLTWEVRDGIAHHSGKQPAATLEGRCVHFADRIAYINHDIDDALRAGVLKRDDLPRGCVATLGDTHGKRLNTMIADIVTSSAGRDEVKMSDEIWQASMELRTFLFSRVYSRDWAAGEEKKADHVVEALYRYYAEHPGQMPLEYVEISYREGLERSVCDYIACMTDGYAVATYQKLFVPAAFDSL